MSRVSTSIQFGVNVYDAEYSSLGGLYWAQEKTREIMDLQRIYYLNNGLYDTLRAALYLIGAEKSKARPLRNPAYRVVEFYASKQWPGTLPDALPMELLPDANPAIEERIRDIWVWSNWSARKQVAARWQAIYGNSFLKVAGDPERGQVLLQLIDPRYVVDFDLDDRDVITYIRIDTPIRKRNDSGEEESWTHTEIWEKYADRLRIWEHQRGYGASRRELPQPIADEAITERTGVDFVPVVHAKNRDIGEDLGVGAFQLQTDKIDEVNRQATRLHQILYRYNKPLFVAMANMVDAMGRPMPAPKLAEANSDDEVELDDDDLMSLPGMMRLDALVPNLNYGSHLDAITAQMREIERDLPELAYYELREQGDLSGVAIDLLLSDAEDRLLEARGNGEAGMIRAQQMALSIGQAMGLPGFSPSEIGTYDTGSFDHRFRTREALPMTELQRLDLIGKATQAGLPLVTGMRRAGYSDEEIEQTIEDQVAERKRALNEARAYLAQQRAIDGAGVYDTGNVASEDVGGNPWDIFRVDGRYCVYEVDEDGNRHGEPEDCYDTRGEAEDLLEALYANVEDAG